MKRILKKKVLITFFFPVIIIFSSFGQLSISLPAVNYTIDFDNTVSGVNFGTFTGSGFASIPTAGQLDSDGWSTSGMSDGDGAFGGSYTSGDFARGSSAGGVTTGGFYAFDIGSGNFALGVQPGGSDWAPGSIVLKITNNTSIAITSIDISYVLYVLNDQNKANSFNFSYSTNNLFYNDVASLDYTSEEVADGSPAWQSVARNTMITGSVMAAGGSFYIRWTGEEVSGSGSMDEFALDDIVIKGYHPASEPSNHVTLFSATADSYSEITNTWNDNDNVQGQVAHGFLILANTSGTFTDPVDGTQQVNDIDLSDGSGVMNVAHGVETYTWTGLTPSTTYYFKIWPYTNSGIYIDYKTGGSVPDASATTNNLKVFISEYIEGSSNNKAIEIFNGESNSIDLTEFTINRYTNGSSISSSPWTGNSVLASKAIYVLYYSGSSTAISEVGDESATVTYFNGNDAVELIYNSTSIDVIGIIGNDPGTGWDVAGTTNATANHTLVRKLSIQGGNTNWTNSAGTNTTDSEWIVLAEDHFMNLGFYGSIWTGVTDNSWNDNDNWDIGTPTGTINAKIPTSLTNYPTLSAAGSCYNITIQSGASLLGVNYLTVNGTATVQQEISAYTTSSNGWNLISCPMSNTDVSTSDWVTGDYDLYRFDEATNYWLNQENAANATLFDDYVPGIGYLYANSATVTNSLTGSFNSADVTVSGLTKTTGQGVGWHLLGNPYPSALEWGGWTHTNMVISSAQILKANGDGYTTRSAGQFIPANQGFFVEVDIAPGSLTIPISKCVHSTQLYSAKSTPVNDLTLRLFLDTTRNVEHRIMFKPNATDNFDWAYDAHYLPPWDADVPKLYSKIGNDEYLALNAFNFNGNKSIPLGIEVQSAVNLNLMADGIQSFANDVSIILEDTYNTMFYDFRQQNPATIALAPADGFGRYVLHFSSVTEVDESSTPGIEVYAYNNSIYLNPGNFTSGNAYVQVFNTLGQEVYQISTTLTGLTKIPVDLPTANYFVRINTGKELFSEKVFVQ